MRAMPKTLDIQGFSGLREEVVRLEGSPPRAAVLQALIATYCNSKPGCFTAPGLFIIFAFLV